MGQGNLKPILTHCGRLPPYWESTFDDWGAALADWEDPFDNWEDTLADWK